MEKVPKMISTKDMAYITDMFNWNYLAVKKLCDYSECVEDEEICEKFKELTNMHQNNCEKLIKLLEWGESNEN
jgi:hypothetical protein